MRQRGCGLVLAVEIVCQQQRPHAFRGLREDADRGEQVGKRELVRRKNRPARYRETVTANLPRPRLRGVDMRLHLGSSPESFSPALGAFAT